MFETIKSENPRAYEQWEFWKNGEFGGLPWETILSSPPRRLNVETEFYINRGYEMEQSRGLILLSSVTIDDFPSVLESPVSLYFDRIIQTPQRPCYIPSYSSYYYDRWSPESYVITEQNVAFYLESLPIKEELKKHFGSLVSLVCDYLNRDKRRMESAQEYIMRKGCIPTGKNTNDRFLEAYEDRASTIAQINALCLGKVIPPFKEENSTARQESTTESKTETHSIEPPEEIQNLFQPYIQEGELILSDRPLNGRRRYILTSRSQSSFAVHVKEMTQKAGRIEIKNRIMKEWIYKPEGIPYSRNFYKEQS